MKFLLTAATAFEIRPLLEKLNPTGLSSGKISGYHYRNFEIDVLITGVGMVSTAYHLGKLLGPGKYDLAINAGFCGSFSPEMPVGAVIHVVEDSFPECGVEDREDFITMFELGLDDPAEAPFIEGKLINNNYPGVLPLLKLPKVRAVSVNTVHGNKKSIENIIKRFNPDVESMEGAAFFYACMMENVTCMQVRSVSNLVEERNKSKWKPDLACKNLNRTLISILNEL